LLVMSSIGERLFGISFLIKVSECCFELLFRNIVLGVSYVTFLTDFLIPEVYLPKDHLRDSLI